MALRSEKMPCLRTTSVFWWSGIVHSGVEDVHGSGSTAQLADQAVVDPGRVLTAMRRHVRRSKEELLFVRLEQSEATEVGTVRPGPADIERAAAEITIQATAGTVGLVGYDGYRGKARSNLQYGRFLLLLTADFVLLQPRLPSHLERESVDAVHPIPPLSSR